IVFMLSLVVILVFSSVTAFAESTNEIVIAIDSSKVEFNDDLGFPFLDENNRTMVPFMATLVKYGATVTWNDENRSAVAVKGDITVEVPIGQNYILKNGEKIDTDTAAKIVNERTYLPIRAVIEAFGSEVQWDKSLKTVVITTEPIDAKAIFTAANDKSYDWENYDADVTMDMSMAIPDDNGTIQTMKMNMYITIFMNPMKAKISADMVMDVLGEEISQPVMDMYLSLDDNSYTTYIGTNDSTGKLTWMKSTVEDEMLTKLMNYDKEKIQANKELMAKYIKDVKYFGKYTDEAGKTLLKMEYTMSSDIYKDMLGEYVEELSASINEQEQMTAEMLKGLVEGNMGDLTFIVYIDEALGEIVKYEMDLGTMISNIVSGMTESMADITEEDMAVLNGLRATMVMEILNVNEAEEFEIPAEALKATEMTEMLEQMEDATETEVTE
ncbi:MAG: copper amine oxidase N-terminal domain-containing protein, partial [Sedimentibacter sp.]